MLRISKSTLILRNRNNKTTNNLLTSTKTKTMSSSSSANKNKCEKTMLAKDLRVGLMSRDTSSSSSPLLSITGFSHLKSTDQEALNASINGGAQTPEEVCEKEEEKSINEEDRISKKTKLSTPAEEVKMDISFSVSDVKAKYKDATLLPKWKAFQTVIFLEREEGLNDAEKIAAFDFDGCLANTSVRRVGAHAWSLMYSSIPEKLQSLYNEGFKLVIFTNESNIDRWKNKRQVAVDSKIGRLNNFIKLVNLPIQVFIACGIGKSEGKDDLFRKPKPGMWYLMEQLFNSGISIDMDQSFYVGDAAGRPKDHSDADIKFAETIGLRFYVPEDYFTT